MRCRASLAVADSWLYALLGIALCALFFPITVAAEDWRLPTFGGEADAAATMHQAPAFALADAPLGLLDLTDIALRNNPLTHAAWARVREQAAALGIARAAYWPQLDATLSLTRDQMLSGRDAFTGAVTRYGPAVSLSYLLWDFGARAGATAAAKAELIGAQLIRRQTFQDVMLEVEQRYYQVQGLQRLTAANRKTVASAQASVEAAEKQHASGLVTIGDVYRARASLSEAELNLQQSRGDLASARGALASAIGLAPDTELDLQPWASIDAGMQPLRTVAQTLAQARTARPELLAAKADVRAARARVRQAVGNGLPSVNLNARAGHTRIAHRRGATDYSVGAQVEIPLFSGFRHRHERAQAEARVERAQADREILLRQVETEVWQAYQNVLTAEQTLASSADLLQSASRAEEAARGRYRNGLENIVDLLAAQATLADARARRVQAQVNYHAALADLGHAAGGLPLPHAKDAQP